MIHTHTHKHTNTHTHTHTHTPQLPAHLDSMMRILDMASMYTREFNNTFDTILGEYVYIPNKTKPTPLRDRYLGDTGISPDHNTGIFLDHRANLHGAQEPSARQREREREREFIRNDTQIHWVQRGRERERKREGEREGGGGGGGEKWQTLAPY
jgi:hypothetical protein